MPCPKMGKIASSGDMVRMAMTSVGMRWIIGGGDKVIDGISAENLRGA